MNDAELLQPNERIDDLQVAGYRIIQRPDLFRFGTDSVLLARFAKVRGAARVVDLGAGAGALSLLIAARSPQATFNLVEVQPEMADMARRSVQLNGLENRFNVHNLDMRSAADALGRGSFDVAVLNPPYGKAGGASPNLHEPLRIARHEVCGEFPDYAAAMGLLLRNGGDAYIVHLTSRLLDVLDAVRAVNLQPKKLRFIHPRADASPSHFLLHARKNVSDGLQILSPIVARDNNGEITEQLERIYNGDETV